MKDRTKWEYSHALIELMKHKPLQKVTVREICRACDARPQNFYYHFKDKYDLVAWIYGQDIESVATANMEKSWLDVLCLCYQNMLSRRAFYRNAFEDDSTNCLIRYVVDFQIELYTGILKRKGAIIDESLTFAIIYHACACAEITRRWLTSPQPSSPEQFSALIMDAMPAKLRIPLGQDGLIPDQQNAFLAR